ncbi:glycosyltransferase family 2 protein [Dermacoccaceae bacterium W4C1]
MAMVTDASPGVDPFSDPFSVPASADQDAQTAVTALLVVQGDFRRPAGAADTDEDGTAEADGAGLESDGSDQPGENPRLSRTFAALAAQTRRPNRLVVVDATPERGLRERLDAMAAADLPWSFAATDLTVVVVPAKDRRPTFAEIVDTAVEALPGPGEELVVAKRVRSRARRRQTRPRDRQEWLWLLHEDSAPAPDALRNLERVVSRSERIGIAGCKVVDADRPDTLVNVGLDLTRTGRHVGTHMEGEPDQGQHDDRHDVLAVSSAGLLVRRDVYLSLGGFEPAFDGDGDGLDLCWRTHLLGHQVVVVPDAVVHQQIHDPEAGRTLRSMGRADADRPAPRSGRTLRRHRQVALARCSWIGLPFMALWIALSSAVLALLMLVLKRPRRSLAELAQASAPLGVARILGARTRFGSRGRTRRRHLGALFISGSAAGRDAWDAMRSALTPSRPSDQDTVAPHRHSATVRALRNPGLWVVLLLSVVTAVRWRPLLAEAPLRGSGHGLTGGELLPFDTDADGIWRLWRDAWGGSGLGHAGYDHPYLVVLAPITKVVGWLPWVNEATAGATVVTWLLLAAVPAAG